MYVNVFVCVCVCVCVCVICFLGLADFTIHLYSSVQKPKKVKATPTAAGRDPAKGSGCDDFNTIAQESKLIFHCIKIMIRNVYYTKLHTVFHMLGIFGRTRS